MSISPEGLQTSALPNLAAPTDEQLAHGRDLLDLAELQDHADTLIVYHGQSMTLLHGVSMCANVLGQLKEEAFELAMEGLRQQVIKQTE